MLKRTRTIGLLAMILAFAVLLGACSSKYPGKFVGEWVPKDSIYFTPDQATLTTKSDGSFTLDSYAYGAFGDQGTHYEGTWEALEGEQIRMIAGSRTATATLEGDVLTIGDAAVFYRLGSEALADASKVPSVQVELSVPSDVTPLEITPDQSIPITIAYQNTGEGSGDLMLDVFIPQGVILDESSVGAAGEYAYDHIMYTLGTVDSGQNGEESFAVSIDPAYRDAKLDVVANYYCGPDAGLSNTVTLCMPSPNYASALKNVKYDAKAVHPSEPNASYYDITGTIEDIAGADGTYTITAEATYEYKDGYGETVQATTSGNTSVQVRANDKRDFIISWNNANVSWNVADATIVSAEITEVVWNAFKHGSTWLAYEDEYAISDVVLSSDEQGVTATGTITNNTDKYWYYANILLHIVKSDGNELDKTLPGEQIGDLYASVSTLGPGQSTQFEMYSYWQDSNAHPDISYVVAEVSYGQDMDK